MVCLQCMQQLSVDTLSPAYIQLQIKFLADYRTITMSPGVNVLDVNLLMVQFVEIISKMFPYCLTHDVHCCCDQPCFRGPRLREELYLSWISTLSKSPIFPTYSHTQALTSSMSAIHSISSLCILLQYRLHFFNVSQHQIESIARANPMR
jgi:hypothetical protein